MPLRFLSSIALVVGLTVGSGCKPEAQASFPDRRGGRGESCLVTNDCKEPLLCLSGRCLDESLSFEPTGKACATAQCLSKTDCCPPLSKPRQASCDKREKECKADPTSFECRSYEYDCKCKASCEDHLCKYESPLSSECEKSSECSSDGALRCVRGSCVQCTKDSECGTGYLCDRGRCEVGCSHDEECGELEACEKLRCVDRGCKSDRECAIALGVRDGVCLKGECGVPCKSDAACGSLWGSVGVSACVDGLCKWLGCASNTDCQADRVQTRGDGIAVCVPATEADDLRSEPWESRPGEF